MTRRLIALLTMALLAAALLLPTAALAADTDTEDETPANTQTDHNIDYSKATTPEKYILRCKENQNIYIDMSAERLFVPADSGIIAISFDGGKKWTRYTIPETGLIIEKMLNKGGIFQLTDSLDSKGKAPVKEDVKDEDGTVTTPKSKIYQFAAIAPRPKVEKFMVNYSVYADRTGATPGAWTLTEKNSDMPMGLAYQIAPSSNKKTPDVVTIDGQGQLLDEGAKTATWGSMPKNQGINVLPLSSNGTKVTKTTYLIRTEPTPTIPASKTKKITVSGLSKIVKFKADYKKDLIKLKENASVFVGDETDLLDNTDKKKVTVYSKDTAKTGRAIGEEYGKTLSIWVAATQKKPASSPQFYTPAARAFMDESTQPTFTASTVKIDTKKYEVKNPDKGTYGTSVPKVTGDKAVTTFDIRMKATAKAGKETATTYAPSLDGKLVVTWGVVDETNNKSGIVDAYLEAPEYKGILRGQPNKSAIDVVEMSAVQTITYNIVGFRSDADKAKLEIGSSVADAVPGDDEIWVVPNVTYGSTSDPDDAIELDLTLSGSTATLKVTPNVPCTATIGLKFIYGSDYKLSEDTEEATLQVLDPNPTYYDEARSGSRPVKVKITQKEGSPEMTEVSYATAAEVSAANVRAVVATNAKGSTRIDRAAVSGSVGIMSISRDGTLVLNSVKVKDGTSAAVTVPGTTPATGESLYYALYEGNLADLCNKAKFDVSAADTFKPLKNATLTVKTNQWLILKHDKGNSDVKILYVFQMQDKVGPAVVSSSYTTNSITLNYDEPLKDGNPLYTLYYDDEVLSVSGSVSGNVVTINTGVPAGEVAMLSYGGGNSLQDLNSNNAITTQISLGTVTGLASIQFGNGYNGTPLTFANPAAITDMTSDYSNKIIYVPLNSTSACDLTVTAEAGATVNYGLYASKQTKAPSSMSNTLTSGITSSVFGWQTDWYLYVRVTKGANVYYYCFYISRTTAASGDSAALTPTAAVSAKTANSITVQVSFNKAVSPLEYGIRLSELGVSGIDGITLSSVYFDRGKLYVILSGNTSGITSASKLVLSYAAPTGSYNCILGPGNMKLSSFSNLSVGGMGIFPAPPSTSPSP